MNRWETPWGLTMEHLVEKWKHVVDAGAECWSWTSEHELSFLCELASRSKSICEIGSYYGRSSLTMALANRSCQILSVDNCENEEVPDRFYFNLTQQILSGQVVFLKGTSEDLSLYGTRFDACFIDGGHLFQDVECDINCLKPRMNNGALMVGHDFNSNPDDGVNKAVRAAFPGGVGVYQSLWWTVLP